MLLIMMDNICQEMLLTIVKSFKMMGMWRLVMEKDDYGNTLDCQTVGGRLACLL